MISYVVSLRNADQKLFKLSDELLKEASFMDSSYSIEPFLPTFTTILPKEKHGKGQRKKALEKKSKG